MRHESEVERMTYKGFTIVIETDTEDPITGDTLDSCWGFYAVNNGDREYMIQCARDAVDCELRRREETLRERVNGIVRQVVEALYPREAVLAY
jgi:hypothetical protein